MADNHYQNRDPYQSTNDAADRQVRERGRAVDARICTDNAFNDYRTGRSSYLETFRRVMYGEYYDPTRYY